MPALRTALALLVLLGVAPLVRPQTTMPSAPPEARIWNADEWWNRATVPDLGRAALEKLIADAAEVATSPSIAFLMRLADGFPDRPGAESALRALAAEPGVSFVDFIMLKVEKAVRPDDKRRLWTFIDAAAPHRVQAFRTFLRMLKEKDGDDDRIFALARLDALLGVSRNPEEVALISDTIFENFQRSPADAVGDAIFRLSRRFPIEKRVDFDLAALRAPAAPSAVRAARDLLDQKVEDGERVIAAAIFGDGSIEDRERLFLGIKDAMTPVLLTRLIAAADGRPWTDIGRIAALADARELERGVPFLRKASADATMPRSAVFAVLLLARARRPTTPEMVRPLLDLSLPHAVTAVLAHSPAGDRPAPTWKDVRMLAKVDSEETAVDCLDAIADLRLTGPRVTGWLLPILKSGTEGYAFAAALRADAVAGDPTIDRHIAAALAAKKWQVRLAAVEALVEWQDYAAVPFLIQAVADEHERIGRLAVEGLRRTFKRDVGMAQDAWTAIAKGAPESGAIPVGPTSRPAEDRYGPRFYGLDFASNKVVFVCDASGSMEGGKIERLKLELNRAIDSLEVPGAFNVVIFSDVARALWTSIQSATKERRSAAKELVRRFVANGGTNAWSGLADALEDPEADTIVFLTDGQPSAGRIIEPQKILDAVRGVNRRKRMTIHAIWLEDGVDARTTTTTGPGAEFLKSLASENGGRFVVALSQ